MAKEKTPSTLSSFDLAAIGGLAGLVEVTLQQPTVTAKNLMQRGLPIPLNPAVLYRGWLVNSASVGPICCLQFGTNRFLESSLHSLGVPSSSGTLLGTAAMTGIISSSLSCPAEMIMLHQQVTGNSLYKTSQVLASEYGMRILWRGMVPTVYREALWVGSYLGLVPVLTNTFSQLEALKEHPTATWAAASISTGIIAGTITHPLDTIKTRMQAYPEAEAINSKTFRAATRSLTAVGMTALFAGFIPRTTRIIGACFILSAVKDKASSALEEHRAGPV